MLRPGLLRAAVIVLPLAAIPCAWGPLRPPRAGEELLAEVESSYQYLQVVRTRMAGRPAVKLEINEGLDSFHSVALEGTAYTDGLYYDYFAAVPFLVAEGVVPQPLRVLSLGAAAGTFSRLFAAAFPGRIVDGVEIDPAVLELGDRYFGGRGGEGSTFTLDARVFVERVPNAYEAVLVDAYERQMYVPAHVASAQFFEAVRRALVEGGVVAVNSGGRTFEDPVVGALARTMAAVFGGAEVFRVPRSRNFLLLARKGKRLDPTLLKPDLGNSEELRAILGKMAFVGAWRRFEAGPPMLDDDRPLLDCLQEEALSRDLGFPGVVPMHGDQDPASVWRSAQEMMTSERDYGAALLLLQHAREATPALRLLAGDVRWYLHDLEGALREYEKASSETGGRLAREAALRVESAAEALAARHVGKSTARFSGVLALGLLALFGVCVWVAGRRLDH